MLGLRFNTLVVSDGEVARNSCLSRTGHQTTDKCRLQHAPETHTFFDTRSACQILIRFGGIRPRAARAPQTPLIADSASRSSRGGFVRSLPASLIATRRAGNSSALRECRVSSARITDIRRIVPRRGDAWPFKEREEGHFVCRRDRWQPRETRAGGRFVVSAIGIGGGHPLDHAALWQRGHAELAEHVEAWCRCTVLFVGFVLRGSSPP